MTAIPVGKLGPAGYARLLDPTSPPHPWLLAPWELPRATAELTGSLILSPALLALHRVGQHGVGQHGVGRLDSSGTPTTTHPVLVVPGLRGGNSWTVPLRGYLRALGHDVRTPYPQTMKAGRVAVVRTLTDQIERLADGAGAAISVLAWSIGGCFARQAAAASPHAVRRVITLGTPIKGSLWYGRGRGDHELDRPVTALYSRTDGIIDWRRCVLPAGSPGENVEIISSHFGMSTNPQALHVIGDRLRQS